MEIDIENLALDVDEEAFNEKREKQLLADEVPIEAVNECESGACAI